MDIGAVIERLKGLTLSELRECYQEVFGTPTLSTHKRHLVRRIAWRLQANEHGDLSKRAEARALEIADDRELRITAPRDYIAMARFAPNSHRISADSRLPVPGMILTRVYKDQKISVKILADGFEYDGQVFRSLSAVARAATGTNWNGLVFFGLGKKKLVIRNKATRATH
jgi:hypothetical protein